MPWESESDRRTRHKLSIRNSMLETIVWSACGNMKWLKWIDGRRPRTKSWWLIIVILLQLLSKYVEVYRIGIQYVKLRATWNIPEIVLHEHIVMRERLAHLKQGDEITSLPSYLPKKLLFSHHINQMLCISTIAFAKSTIWSQNIVYYTKMLHH